MSKILKSVTLGDVKNGGIFRALGKEFVKLDADEHGCLVLAKDIWTKMPFREGDDPECPNDLRRSEIMPYLGNCLAEFTKNGTPRDRTEQCLSATGAESRCSRNGSTMVCLTRKHWMVGRLK